MPGSMRARVLLLGGTGEAATLARLVQERLPDVDLTSSLAGRTREPSLPPGDLRIGGFGGIDGLTQYLEQNAVTLLVNATHPFASQMSSHALAAHRRSDVPLLRLMRPAWHKQAGDTWIKAAHATAAAGICRWLGKRVLLALGSQEIRYFANLPRAHFLVRMVDAPEAPLPLVNHQVLTARGPFTLADERRLMLEHDIDLVVAKNSGGTATVTKIEAARELGVPVVMIDRPEIALHPGCETVATVEEALAWIAVRAGIHTLRSLRTGESKAARGDKA
jgi:precorrin-6A/cobalt-precorrin-6A reductase